MFKRFMIGFVLGVGAMYWYIHNSEAAFSDASQWVQRSASQYRDDKIHQAVDDETDRKR